MTPIIKKTIIEPALKTKRFEHYKPKQKICTKWFMQFYDSCNVKWSINFN